VTGVSGLVFLGWNPLGPKSLICSSADASYSASLQNGLMPRWKRRCFTVFGVMPSFSAISLIVKPSIHIISDILTQKVKKIENLLKSA